jgi:hypothetical protein
MILIDEETRKNPMESPDPYNQKDLASTSQMNQIDIVTKDYLDESIDKIEDD